VSEAQNSAARLHRLLTRFGEQTNLSVQKAWAAALDVELHEVPLELGGVATLMSQVRREAEATGRPEFAPIADHMRTLAQSVLPLEQGMNKQASNVAPNAEAMQALNMLSAYFELGQPAARVPAPKDIEELHSELADLIGQVTGADLPPEIRRELLTRLANVLEALDHLATTGPEGVRRAAESLGMSALLLEPELDDEEKSTHQDDSPERQILRRIKATAGKAWKTFTVTTALASAVLTWDRVEDLVLPQGEPQKQLPPGTEKPSSASDADEDEGEGDETDNAAGGKAAGDNGARGD